MVKKMKILKSISIIISSVIVLTACKKEYDTPPLTYPADEGNITIDSLKQIQATLGSISFTSNYSVEGTITMDENDGNIYKNVYMQDNTGAINVRMLSGGGLYVGDKVKISLNGCYLSRFNGVLQLDSVNADYHVKKESSGNYFAPEVTTIDQLTTAKESELIQLNNVQFVNWELGETYADKDNQISRDHLLEDQNGNTIVVRTSGYASFAGEDIADGSGSIVLIAAVYNGAMQLLIREYSEINFSAPRFSGLALYKDFNDDEITSYGWTTQTVSGTFTQWEASSAGGAPNPYAAISNYDGTNNEVADVWLISPSIDLTGYSTPKFSFENAMNYPGPALQVFISTDYLDGAPSSGNWTDLSGFANWSSGGFTFVNSGLIDISAYITSNTHIAFRYQGTSSTGSTWELDNILIKD